MHNTNTGDITFPTIYVCSINITTKMYTTVEGVIIIPSEWIRSRLEKKMQQTASVIFFVCVKFQYFKAQSKRNTSLVPKQLARVHFNIDGLVQLL